MIGLTSSLFRSSNSIVRTPSSDGQAQQGHDQGERAGTESIDEVGTHPLLVATRAPTPAAEPHGIEGRGRPIPSIATPASPRDSSHRA